MMDLEISPDNRFVAAYTNNGQTVLLNTLVSEFVVIDSPLEANDTVQGICMLDTEMVIYGQSSWVFLDMTGKQLERKKVFREDPILVMNMITKGDFSLIHWSGDMSNPSMAIVTYKVNTYLNVVYLCLSNFKVGQNSSEIRALHPTKSVLLEHFVQVQTSYFGRLKILII